METLDAMTAGLAMVITQFGLALVMLGLFLAARRDAATRMWAISGILIAISIVFPLAQPLWPEFEMVMFGSTAVICGTVFMWWGTRAFYGRDRNNFGWVVVTGFIAVFDLALLIQANVPTRAAAFNVPVAIALILNAYEIQRSRGRHPTFATQIVIWANLATATIFVMRTAMVMTMPEIDLRPGSSSPVSVAVLYLLPLGGTLLGSVGLILMHFERTIDEKEYLATHDELTRLWNRRAMVNIAQREVDEACRLNRPFTVLMVDADHFKQINDKLGHDVGDHVLRSLGSMLTSVCRETDFPARLGGEEFCVLCPASRLVDAQALAERILIAARDIPIPESLGRPVTVSIGIASVEPMWLRNGGGWERALKSADEALYEAKSSGRNRLMIAAAA